MAELKSPVVEGFQPKAGEGIFHNGNPEHYPIPALVKPGSVLMRLELTDQERQAVYHGHDVWIEVLTTVGIQPMRFVVGDKSSPEAREFWKSEGY